MSIDALLSRLEKVRKTGPDSWQACCPSHDDKGPSLSIRDAGGKLLIHCFAGCSVHEIVAVVGMDIADLFPPRESDGKPMRQTFPAMAALQAMAFEASVVLACAASLATGEPLSAVDRDRLVVACGRIQGALSACKPSIRRTHHA